jgi:hypothetical protein
MSKNYVKNILFFLAPVTPSQEFVPIFVVFSLKFPCFHSILLAIEPCRLQNVFKATEN